MNITIVTQAVDSNSPTLGFFVEWLREFSKQCERVDVIGLSVGKHDLPSNVRTVSMGKERGASKPARLLAYWRFLRQTYSKSDGVFIHMCPEYLIAGWPFFMLSRKPVVFWYAHRSNNFLVRFATSLATYVATSVPGAFSVQSEKTRPLGQGIPTDLFAPLVAAATPPFRYAAVGRISPIKRLELLIEALAICRQSGMDAKLELWGSPAVASDRGYKASLRELIHSLGISDHVSFLGAVPFADMPKKYTSIAAALNACPDGAVDKAALEAMSCARPVIVTNSNFKDVLGTDSHLCLADATARSIASKIMELRSVDCQALGSRLRSSVIARHGLPKLVSSVVGLLKS